MLPYEHIGTKENTTAREDSKDGRKQLKSCTPPPAGGGAVLSEGERVPEYRRNAA